MLSQPSGRAAQQHVADGDAQWARGQRDSAQLHYQVAIARDSAVSTRALFRLAMLASDHNRLKTAAALLEVYMRLEPQDDEGRLALARTLAWDGRYQAAMALYDDVLSRDSTYRDAEKGRARVVAWRGDLAQSEQLWRRLVARYPNDAEAWIGLAQVQRWSGRARGADSAMRRAIAIAPGSADAWSQWAWVRAELAGASEPTVVRGTDSDGNRATSYAMTVLARAAGPLRLRFTGSHRDAEYQSLRGASSGAQASLRWSPPGRSLSLSAQAGATRLTSRAGSERAQARILGLVAFSGSGAISSHVHLGATLSRTPFDETATLIAGGIAISGIDTDLSVALPHRVALDAGLGGARVHGGRLPNARRSAVGSMRWTVRRGLSLSAAARGLAYDTTGRADGYFAPHRFALLEGGARFVVGRDLGWGATLDGGLGRQSIRFSSSDPTSRHGAARGAVTLRYAPSPGYELEVAGGASTVASPFAQAAAVYSARWCSLRARLPIFRAAPPQVP